MPLVTGFMPHATCHLSLPYDLLLSGLEMGLRDFNLIVLSIAAQHTRSRLGHLRLRHDGRRGRHSALRGQHLGQRGGQTIRSEEHTSELQSLTNLVCRLLLEKKKKKIKLTVHA